MSEARSRRMGLGWVVVLFTAMAMCLGPQFASADDPNCAGACYGFSWGQCTWYCHHDSQCQGDPAKDDYYYCCWYPPNCVSEGYKCDDNCPPG